MKVEVPDYEVEEDLVVDPGREMVEELAPRPGHNVFEKTRYDGFHGTGLDRARLVHADGRRFGP